MKTFDDWWATLTTREQARMVKEDTRKAWEAATAIEREACAKLCEAMECRTYDKGTPERRAWNEATMDCGKTIRMRANQ